MGAPFSDSFLSILCDPINGERMSIDPSHKAIVNNRGLAYPILSSHTLCLLPRPEQALSHFHSQWKLLRSKLDEEINLDQTILTSKEGFEAETRSRVEFSRKSKIEFKKELADVFSALPNHEAQAHQIVRPPKGVEAQQGLGLTIPLAQPLVGYPQNLFRDWVWGDAENKQYLEICKSTVKQTGITPKRILVIAAGGGRLALDLHDHFSPDFTVALDNSYFFSECFNRICFGNGISMTEFPAAPKSDADRAHRHKIPAHRPKTSNLHFVLGDLNHLPFDVNSFDCVITPWIIDLIPEKLPRLIHNIGAMLQPDGLWINFGSFQINAETPVVFRFNREEVKMLARHADFSGFQETSPTIKYLESPYSAHSRIETLWTLSSRRGNNGPSTLLRAWGIPEWLLDLSRPIPKDQKVDYSEMMHRVPQRVFSLIDGQRSLQDIAEVIATEFEMTVDEAKSSLVGFLSRWSQDLKT
jgi:hypothetical protein